jgi:hypothetical protein
MDWLIKIYALIVFGAIGRTMFQVAYLGASTEHEMAPDKTTTFYMISWLFFVLCFVWCMVLIFKPKLKFRNLQIVAVILLSGSVMAYHFLYS